jgi:hypothetical protein
MSAIGPSRKSSDVRVESEMGARADVGRSGPAYAVVNYEQGVEPFLKTDRLSDGERATLMGGACAKAYRWAPKKA